MDCGHCCTPQTPVWEPGGKRRSGLQSGMNQEEKNVLLLLCVEVLKMNASPAGCVDYLKPGLDPGAGKLGGDSEVEPGRRAASKETCLEDSTLSPLPLQRGFQQVSSPLRERRDRPE